MVACLAWATGAEAALGRSLDSVRADADHMAARMESASAANYTVHTLSLANGGVVREFMAGDGAVFAVSWRGPGRPDLQQLLGDRFEALQSDTVRKRGMRIKVPLAVDRDDFVVHTGGHPGAFWGHAFLPQQLPAGFSRQAFQ